MNFYVIMVVVVVWLILFLFLVLIVNLGVLVRFYELIGLVFEMVGLFVVLVIKNLFLKLWMLLMKGIYLFIVV